MGGLTYPQGCHSLLKKSQLATNTVCAECFVRMLWQSGGGHRREAANPAESAEAARQRLSLGGLCGFHGSGRDGTGHVGSRLL